LNIPIYVIALKGSRRIESFKKEATNQGINYEIHLAVDGNDLSDSEILQHYNLEATYARLGYSIRKALIGCALSHKQVYKKALKSNSDWVVILEEDVQLRSQFMHNIEILVSTLNLEEAIVCQLFTRGERLIKRKSIKDISSRRFVFEFASIPGQAAAYLMNKESLIVASKQRLISGPSDWPNWATNVKFYGTFPYLVFESSEGSSIGSPPFSRKKYWMRNLEKIVGIHFVRFHKHYPNFQGYLKIEIKPLILRILWRLKGRQYFPNQDLNGLWLV
jgi:glycosyl transferase family 25